MSISRRRERLPRARILSRQILISLVVILGLVLSLYLLRRKVAPPETIDTLQVASQGLSLNGEEISLKELWERYTKVRTPRRIDVIFDTQMPWGESWAIRDTLKRLAELQANLTITGLQEW